MERRTWKLIGVIGMAVALGGAIAAGIVSCAAGSTDETAARKQVDAEIARIRASGEPVSGADLKGPDIPDSENGAVVYARAFELAASAMDPLTTKEYNALTSTDPSGRTPELMAKAGGLVEKYKSVIPVIEEAVAKPSCRFPVRWEDWPNVMLPHLPGIRNLSKLLTVKAVVDAGSGRAADALHSVELAMAVTDSIEDEPFLISQAVRTGLVGYAQKTLVVVAGQTDIDEVSARRLHEIISRMDFSKCITTAYEGERVQRIMLVNYYRAHGKLPQEISEMIDTYPGRLKPSDMPPEFKKMMGDMLPPEPLPSGVWAKKFFYADSLYALRELGKMIADTSQPATSLSTQQDDTPPPTYQLSSMEIPMYRGFRDKNDQTIAKLALCQAVLALEVYKNKHSQYPDTLAEATADTGLTIPKDPFSGTSLVYRKQGKGFIAYSIGDNLKDDGGVDVRERTVPMMPRPGTPMPPGVPQPPSMPTPPGFSSSTFEHPDIVVKLDR